jgi:hypothetical protein
MSFVAKTCNRFGPGLRSAMSFAQIIEEIPRLTHMERREIFLQVMSFEPAADDVALCDHVARDGFAILDEMEASDARNG